jgi:hypothetical protein
VVLFFQKERERLIGNILGVKRTTPIRIISQNFGIQFRYIKSSGTKKKKKNKQEKLIHRLKEFSHGGPWIFRRCIAS